MQIAPYFGHERIVQALEKRLPLVSLFLGPDSVGKWELAEHLIRFWKFDQSDVLRVNRLTQDNARAIVGFSQTKAKGDARLVIVKLDHKATKGAQNTLLKALEAPYATHFILVGQELPLPTIRSRAEIFEFGLLTEEEVALVLTERRRYSREKAELLASYSGGQIKAALEYTRVQEDKLTVLKALDAINRKDLTGLESLSASWQQEHTDLLVRWCYEALTKKWKYFISDDSSIANTKIPLRILLSLQEDLRPRLVIRSALASVIQGLR